MAPQWILVLAWIQWGTQPSPVGLWGWLGKETSQDNSKELWKAECWHPQLSSPGRFRWWLCWQYNKSWLTDTISGLQDCSDDRKEYYSRLRDGTPVDSSAGLNSIKGVSHCWQQQLWWELMVARLFNRQVCDFWPLPLKHGLTTLTKTLQSVLVTYTQQTSWKQFRLSYHQETTFINYMNG